MSAAGASEQPGAPDASPGPDGAPVPRRPGARLAARALLAVAAHPQAWAGAIASARRAAPPGWWHRPPFAPVPDASWWAMRTEVAYGAGGGEPSAEELRDLFVWVARMRRWRRR